MKLDPWLHRMPVTPRWCADVLTAVLTWDTQVSAGKQEGAMPVPLASSLQRVRDSLRMASHRALTRDEMTCDRCGNRHDVVWFAPSDIWNAVMRDGDRGNPDEYSFCCPICFMQLADERGIKNTGWLVIPDQGAVNRAGAVPDTENTRLPHEPDYIERTIATVRNHRDADNCWPQWANIFADQIEALMTERAALAAVRAVPESAFHDFGHGPERYFIDGAGFAWRDFPDPEFASMARVNPDNSPIPEPRTYLAPVRAVPDTDRLAEAQERVVRAADRYANLELRACGDPCTCGSAECELVLALAVLVSGEGTGDEG